MRKRRSKLNRNNAFDYINITFMILLMLIMIFPFWTVVVTSFITAGEFYANPIILWPRHATTTAYEFIFANDRLLRSFSVSIFVTVVGTIFYLIVTSALAYGMSKPTLPGRKFFIIILTITMFFSGGLVPYYLLIRSLGLMNTIWCLILPGGVVIWDFIVMKSFFNQLPAELEESAKIDGAGGILIFFRIVIPLSMPLIATFSLFSAVRLWNSWFDAMIFIRDRDLQPLQLVLRQMIVGAGMPPEIMNMIAARASVPSEVVFEEGLKMAIVTVAIIPILLIYPWLQKYFEKGVMIGSIKG